ncbi:MAG: LysR family transcriptional regulator [Candidatus Eisenbacteria bacterium]|uniref:LysR family transcriptional regulator n=1 Tax=Eiseniibacteriota bacterium TaxID=2212470 RepID=A0A937X6H8_UNCEI|nr:LysR family transcriptional regulator [Candidatus Eisenbacteria bacterium]
MQVESLKVFCDVVESKSFSKAAVLNFISQSAVSQQIRSLEERYDQRLIERGKRNLTPTQAGQILYDVSKEVTARLEEMEHRLRRLSKSVGGTVRVATIYSVGLHELHPFVADFMRRFPAVRLRVEYNRANRIYEDVVANAVDIGIVAYPARRSGVEILDFRSDELVIVCPPHHPLAGFKKVELRKLTGQSFIAFDRDVPSRRAIDRILREQDAGVKIVMEFDNIETIKRAVEIDAGVSILPLMTVEREVALGSLAAVHFAKCAYARPLGILIKRGREIPPAMQRFLDVLLGEE